MRFTRYLLAAALAATAFLTGPHASAQMLNTSVRIRVGTGDDVLITGFVIGSTPKTYLFRAGGPALADFGLDGTLRDPQLQLFSGQTVIASNNDWSAGPSAGAIAQAAISAGAFAFRDGSKDAALIATLQPGNYTVQISGADGGTGIALFEAYEIATPASAGTATVRGLVRDGSTGAALTGVTLSFSSLAGANIGTATTNSTGEYSIVLPAGSVYATVSYTGYVSTTLQSTLTANSTVQVEPVLFARNVAGTGVVSGRIANALTGAGLGGATLRFRSGVGVTAGTVLATTTTDASGNYTVSLASGSYTCEIVQTGFVTGYFSCVAVGGTTIANQNSSVTPVLTGSDLRIVLTWGSTPSDLDSHFTGPVAGSTSRFHVYYSAKTATGVNLDVDDTSSYGPETITLSQFNPGVYRYSVHDYTNGGSTTSTAMSNLSGAQVRVFQGSTQIATFNVPSGRTGNLWTVFEMDGNSRAITPINSISNIGGPSAVPSVHEGATAGGEIVPDADLIRRSVGVKK